MNLVSFFNKSIIFFIINIYSNKHQMALKYLKNTKVNIRNILIMTGNFNIRNSNWDLFYSHYLAYSDILLEVADFFYLRFSISINQVPTQYTDNSNNPNSVIDLMFLWPDLNEINNHLILLEYNVKLNRYWLSKIIKNWKNFRVIKKTKCIFFNKKIQEITSKNKKP